VDFVSLSYSESRAKRFDFLASTWTLRQKIAFAGDRKSHPQRFEQLHGEIIAVAAPSIIHELLGELPADQRPVIKLVSSVPEALRMMAQGQAGAGAGNELALNSAARQLGLQHLEAIPVQSFSYHLVTRRGRREELRVLDLALQKLRDSGEFDRLVENYLTMPAPRSPWRDYFHFFSILLGLLATLVLVIASWNQILRRQVRSRTQDLAESESRALSASQKYRDLFENIPIGIYRTSPDGRVLAANPALVKMLGGESFDSIASRNLDENGYEPEYSRQEFRERLETDGEFRAPEVVWSRPDGAKLLVREFAKAVRGPAGEILHYEGAVEDITEQKKAEDAMLASEQRYRNLFENANDIVYTLDLRGNFTSVNQAAEGVSGYSREELLGTAFADLVAPEFQELARGLWVRLGADTTATCELEVVSRKGCRVALELSAWLIFHKNQPAEVQGIARDVTERKQLENQLRHSQKMEAVGLLAGGVAHDFNNLLSVIKGYSDLILESMSAGPQRRAVAEISTAANRAASLTHQLLAFSRQQVLQPKVLDLNNVVANMVGMVGRLIGEDIELDTAPDTDASWVKADPGQLEQVILNLAINARDAMPGGGRLILSVSRVRLDDSSRRGVDAKPGPYVLLRVTDTGVGMDAQTQARIFEPFFTTKETGRGTGLGLATVYGIVKQSGSYIWVSSELGHGTTFEVLLPQVEESLSTKDLGPVNGAVAFRGHETILLVEDELALRCMIRDFLRSCGYDVLEAGRGDEALLLAAGYRAPIHLLVTDLVMPRMSGPELAEALTALRPEVKVLFISGYTKDATVHNGIDESETAFLQKPFAPADLARKAREVLDSCECAAAIAK